MTEIKIGDLVKLRWDHPLSIFSNDIITSNKNIFKHINESGLDMDQYPSNGDPDAAYFVDALRNEDCWKYGQNHPPIMYLGSKILIETKNESTKSSHEKTPNVVHKFLWDGKLVYTILGGWKSSKIEDYFYLVKSEKDFQERPPK